MLRCPHCAEIIHTEPDPGGGDEQSYIEDCSVCCRPILFRVSFDHERGEFYVEASADV